MECFSVPLLIESSIERMGGGGGRAIFQVPINAGNLKKGILAANFFFRWEYCLLAGIRTYKYLCSYSHALFIILMFTLL